MARRDSVAKVSEGLLSAIKDHTKPGFGVLRLTRKDKKTFAKLFFNDNLIYAIELSTYKPKIVTRILTNEFITDTNYTQVLNKYEKNLTDLSVVKYVVDYQLFPERPLATYLKDYFFDAFDELMGWEEVTVEWKANEKLVGPGLSVTPTEPEEILRRMKEREAILTNQLATAWAVHPREFRNLRYVKNFDYADPDYTQQLLMSLPAEVSLTIGETAEYFGLPYFNTEIGFFEIWKVGAIDVIHPEGMLFTNRSDQEIYQQQRANQLATPTQPINTSTFPALQPTIEETIEEETVDFTGDLEETVIEETAEETTHDTTPQNVVLIESEPEVEILEEETVDYLSEAIDMVSPTVDLEDAGSSYTPSASEPHVDDEYYDYSLDLDYELGADADLYKEPEVTVPTVTSTQNHTEFLEENEEMSDTGNSLRAMAQKMKALIADVQARIGEAKSDIVAHDRQISALSNQRKELIAKLKGLDNEIATARTNKTTAETHLQELEAELNEFGDLLK